MEPQDEQKHDSILPKVVAGAALVGAGVLAAKALSDPDNQQKLKDGIQNAQDRGAEVMSKLSDDFEDLRAKVQQKLNENSTSQAAQDLMDKLKQVGDSLKELGSSAQDDAGNMAEDVRSRIDSIREEYENMDDGMDAAA